MFLQKSGGNLYCCTMRPPESNRETSGLEPLSQDCAGPSGMDTTVCRQSVSGTRLSLTRSTDFQIGRFFRFPSVRLPRMERPPVLALPTEPLRGLGCVTPLYGLQPTAALPCSCCPPYRTGTIWLPRFRDALPGPCGGVEPPSPVLDRGIAVMLTRDMELAERFELPT